MSNSEDEVVIRLRLADARKFVEDVKSGKKSVEDLERTVSKAGKIAQMQAGESGGLGALPGMMRGLVYWGARGTAVLASAAAGVGVYAVKSAASLEQVTVAFTTLLHSASAAKSMVADLQQFAIKTPFELSGVEQTSQRLLAFGFSARSVVPMLTAIGNAASGLNLGQQGMDEIALVLGQMKSLGRIQGGDLLQLAQHGINGYGLLEQGLGLTPVAFQKAMQAGKISAAKGIPILLAGMQKQFKGLMDKESGTLGGIASNFHDAIQQGLIKLANPFLPTMKSWLNRVTGYLGGKDGKSGLFGRAAKFEPIIGHEIATGDGHGLAVSLGSLFRGFSGKDNSLPGVEKAFTVVKNLGTIVRTVIIPAAKDLAGVLAPLVLVLGRLDKVTQFVIDHSDAFHRGLVILIGAIVAYRLAVFAMNKGLAADAAIRGWIKLVKTGTAVTNGQKLALLAWKGASAVAQGALAAVKAVNMAAWWLAQRAGLLAYKSAQMALVAAQRIWIEMKFWAVIAKVGAQWVIARARLVAYRAMMLAVRLATLAWTGAQWLLNVAMDANPVGVVILAVIGLIAIFVLAYKKIGWFRNGVNAVWSWIKHNWPLVLGFLTGPIGAAVAVILTHWDTIKNGFKSVINWVIGKWNWLAGHLSISIPGFTFAAIPAIPLLANGGTAVQPGTAVVGDRGPELVNLPRGASVIPLPRGREAYAGDGMDRVTVIQIEGREVARAVHRYQDDRMARR